MGAFGQEPKLGLVVQMWMTKAEYWEDLCATNSNACACLVLRDYQDRNFKVRMVRRTSEGDKEL